MRNFVQKSSKVFLFLFSIVFIFSSFQQIVSAEASITSKSELAEMSQKYGVEFVPLEGSELEKLKQAGELKTFKNFDEYAEYIKDMTNEVQQNPSSPETFSVQTNDAAQGISTMAQNSHIINWYAPMSGGLSGVLTWKNVSIVYNYTTSGGFSTFTGISSIKSYLTGVQAAVSWEQLSAVKSYSKQCKPQDTANFTIKGYYLVGAEIYGVPIGAKINDTWNTSYTLPTTPGLGCF